MKMGGIDFWGYFIDSNSTNHYFIVCPISKLFIDLTSRQNYFLTEVDMKEFTTIFSRIITNHRK